MSSRSVKRVRKIMRKFVNDRYDAELKGMCSYKFWRRFGIALRIIVGKAGNNGPQS
jgi:hypothetical protein